MTPREERFRSQHGWKMFWLSWKAKEGPAEETQALKRP